MIFQCLTPIDFSLYHRDNSSSLPHSGNVRITTLKLAAIGMCPIRAHPAELICPFSTTLAGVGHPVAVRRAPGTKQCLHRRRRVHEPHAAV